MKTVTGYKRPPFWRVFDPPKNRPQPKRFNPNHDAGGKFASGGTAVADYKNVGAWADAKHPESERFAPGKAGVAFRIVPADELAGIKSSGEIVPTFGGMGHQAPGVYVTTETNQLSEYGSATDTVLALHIEPSDGVYPGGIPGTYRLDGPLPAARIVDTYSGALRFNPNHDAGGKFASGGAIKVSDAPKPLTGEQMTQNEAAAKASNDAIANAEQRLGKAFPNAQFISLRDGTDHIDPQLAGVVADRSEKFAAEFPEAASQVHEVMMTGDMPDSVMAQTGHFGIEQSYAIQLNSGYFGDPSAKNMAQATDEMKNSGFHAESGAASIMDHELGHVLDYSSGNSSAIYHGTFSMPSARDSISRYAEKSSGEAFAEAFTVRQAEGIGALKNADVRTALSEAIGKAGGDPTRAKKRRRASRWTCAGYVPADVMASLRYNPNHDASGKFASGQAGADFGAMQVATQLTGGFTVNPTVHENPTHGYQVAVPGHAEVIDAEEFESMSRDEGAARVRDYMEKNAEVFSQPNMAIGGWEDGGKVYLEPSETIEDHDQAVAAGVARGQKEIYDNAAHQTITTGTTAARFRDVAPPVERDVGDGEGSVRGPRLRSGRERRARRRERRREQQRGRVTRQFGDIEAGVRFNPNHDAGGKFTSGSSAPKEAGGEHAVGVSSNPNSMSLHTLTGPQQPGESDEHYNQRLFDVGMEKYPPDQEIANEAHEIRQEMGLPDPQIQDFHTLETSVDRTHEIGEAFKDAKSDPYDPTVQEAYANLKAQTANQWEHLTGPPEEGGLGVKVDFVSPDDIRAHYGDPEGLNPYPTAQAQRDDLANNHHLAIASIADYPEAYHPILTNERGGDYDMFRAVHDAYGHAGSGSDFTRHGEYAAWVEHSSMFTGSARLAASTELTGENSFLVSFHEPADHKAALLPTDLIAMPFDSTGKLIRMVARYTGMYQCGCENEILQKYGVVNPHNALFGKIVQQRAEKANKRFNPYHGEHGHFTTGGGVATVNDGTNSDPRMMLATVPVLHGFDPRPPGMTQAEGKAWFAQQEAKQQAQIDKWAATNAPAGSAQYEQMLTAWSSEDSALVSRASMLPASELQARIDANPLDTTAIHGLEMQRMMSVAPTMAEPLYRGAGLPDMQPGGEFNLAPSSFSRSDDVAVGRAVLTDANPTVIEVQGGVRGLPVDGLSKYPEEQEVISAGHFSVVSVDHATVSEYGKSVSYQRLVVKQS